MHTEKAKIFIGIIIIVRLLAVFIIFFYITIIRHQKKNIQLNKERTYTEISTLEKEPKRISADPHDGLGPLLSAVKFQIKSVGPVLGEDKKMILSAGNYIGDMLIRIREIAND